MANFETGVSGYIQVEATVRMSFPVDLKGNAYICCDACRFYRQSARRCALIDEPILWSGRYVGRECPFGRKDENEAIQTTATG